ncbi:MAG: hypothetical protein A2252_01550 [Elusimicrobia bacterium RIFOXYA2_FULL_39_19]|nr:MAG: hypothetical protein A2252_01550 [Elusimicrobia bacterium RIFOXYA2_FULL_39_19]
MFKVLIVISAGAVFYLLINKLIEISDKARENKLQAEKKHMPEAKIELKNVIKILQTQPKSKVAQKIKAGIFIFFFFAGLLILKDFLFSIAVGFFGYLLPAMIISSKSKKMKEKFDDQLIDALGLISNCVRSGASLQQALEVLVKESKPPIKHEFEETLSQINLGVSIEDAFKGMCKKLNSRDLDLAVLVINVGREYGGNLGENLVKISSTMRERKKIQNKIDAITSQGKMSAWIITFVPFIILFMLNLMEPDIFGLMFKTLIGKILLLVSIFMVALGNFIIMKIVTVDV